MAIVQLLTIFLCFVLSFTECSDVFVSVGDSVQLHTQEPLPEFTTFIWKFNKTEKVLEYLKKYNDATAFPHLKDRGEFNKETYSLTLNNLQKNDSGLYEAIASGQKDTVVAAYNLSVWDPVEPPVLTSFPNKSKSDLCNITVSCRSDDLSINFMCYNKTCQEKTESQSGNTVLSVFINESSIICNHSNPASWKNVVLKMKRFCGDKDTDSSQGPAPFHKWPMVLTIVIVIIIFNVILILIIFRRRTSKVQNRIGDPQFENTLYAEVQPNGENIPLEQPSTVYSVVGAKRQTSGAGERSQTTPSPEKQQTDPTTPTNTYESVTDMKQQMPETVYATVSKPRKSMNED
ncbi:CD48 antigen-like [Hoplias malabaricus]|uniref:CD48 antigen-like n=1 Tax=Hoplias malabaricus TaxID=27720 RepID=UPI0034625107